MISLISVHTGALMVPTHIFYGIGDLSALFLFFTCREILFHVPTVVNL